MKRIVAAVLFFSFYYFLAASAAELQAPCPKSFEVFKSEVHPFLRKSCAGCHGDEGKDFDRLEFMAPPHSVSDPLASYLKTRGYLNLGEPAKSRLVTIGENGHCTDKGGDEGCGAKVGQISDLIKDWIIEEKACGKRGNVVSGAPTSNGRPLSGFFRKPSKTNLDKIADRFEDVEQVALGSDHTCVIVEDGKVKCFGGNRFGQLGDFNINNDLHMLSLSLKDNLRPLNLGERALQIGAGINFTCALLESHTVKCWGRQTFNELGYGLEDSENSGKFLTVNLGESLPKELYVAGYHACALMVNGELKCWGDDEGMLFGADFKEPKKRSTPVPPLNFGDNKIVTASVGSKAICAIFENGDLKCWGSSDYLTQTNDLEKRLAKLRPIPLPKPAMAVTVGREAACALLETKDVICWGSNQDGLLGQDNGGEGAYERIDIKKLKPIALPEKVKSIAAANRTVCALLESGIVKCWGANEDGEIGSGDMRERIGLLPGDMKSLSPVLLNGKAIDLAASAEQRFCAIVPTILGDAKTPTKLLKCWGDNYTGELGNGDTESRGMLDVGGAEAIPPALIFKSTPRKEAPK